MTIWQQLGALVATAENLSNHHLDEFTKVGGKWITPVLLGDDASGPWNLANLPAIQRGAAARGVGVGGWFNGWGKDPARDAFDIATVTLQHQLKPVLLDLESPYQAPGGNADLMPLLVKGVHDKLPAGWPVCVSTNGLNNSMIYNGRTLNPPQSFYDLGIRVAPQWYSYAYQQDGNTTPEARMKWLRDFGGTDFNFRDPDAPKTSHRGMPLSYVHPTIEVTGLEGSDLADTLKHLHTARQYGLTPGFQLYLLENIRDTDWPLLAAERGSLYLD